MNRLNLDLNPCICQQMIINDDPVMIVWDPHCDQHPVHWFLYTKAGTIYRMEVERRFSLSWDDPEDQ